MEHVFQPEFAALAINRAYSLRVDVLRPSGNKATNTLKDFVNSLNVGAVACGYAQREVSQRFSTYSRTPPILPGHARSKCRPRKLIRHCIDSIIHAAITAKVTVVKSAKYSLGLHRRASMLSCLGYHRQTLSAMMRCCAYRIPVALNVVA